MPCHDLRPASVTFVPFKVSTAQPVGHARMLAAFVPLGLAVGGLQGARHTTSITFKACSVRLRTGRESDLLKITGWAGCKLPRKSTRTWVMMNGQGVSLTSALGAR